MTASPPPGRGEEPVVVGRGDVAFLDAPGLTADELFATIRRVLAGMPAGAILTVYTDDPAVATEAPGHCTRGDLILLAAITHDGRDGTTLAVCRSGGSAPTQTSPHPRLPPKT